MFKTIIFATDGSAAADRVLIYTEHVARIEGAQVVVVHAYELPQAYEWAEGYAGLESQFRQVAEEVVEDAVAELQRGGVQAVADVRQGSASQAILDAARAHKADLIVIGSRVRSHENVAEMLLGSVSALVLRYAPCPVLAVP
ncbi:MAG: universal stress protein [Anaerolineales bacterium]|nr:MAG: universal stress protein [Anaerolineales bacterium]